MPENWKCKSFGTDWVCHSSLSKKKKEAMIILTAKQAGVLDNFQQYTNFLGTPRQNKKLGKKSFTSKVLHSKQIFINNQPWVDGFHEGSEIPFYYTRYLVTVCCSNSSTKLAILVTYSAHKNHYTKYATDFLKSIKSLRVINSKNFGNIKGLIGPGESIGNIAGYMEDLLDDDSDGISASGDSPLVSLAKKGLPFLAIILGAIAFYFIRRKRKKKKKSKNKKPKTK